MANSCTGQPVFLALTSSVIYIHAHIANSPYLTSDHSHTKTGEVTVEPKISSLCNAITFVDGVQLS